MAEGLRERKKQRTREQIIEAAMGLFAERGYQATTIADIATAADVAPRTFFSYFPSKEAVVFHTVDRDLDGLASALRDRLPDETAFDALRRWIDGMYDNWMAEEDAAVLRKRLCREDEGLTNFQGGVMARIQELLLEAIARDLDEPQDSLRPRLVAAAAMAALHSLDNTLDEKPDQHVRETKTEALAVLDDAMLFLRGGIDALQDK
jgi:AcrR family transcriptional regulator